MKYGQFCPIAKAMEVLGDRWTMLIVREVLLGATRFSDLERGLGTISTSVLSERLKDLVAADLLVRKRVPGRRGHEYYPTAACRDLEPVVLALGKWGLRWAKERLSNEDYDVELLMLYLERSVKPEMLPGTQTVLRFEFSDLKVARRWWLVVGIEGVDVCEKDPGQDVDVYVSSTIRTMTDVWLGHRTYRDAMEAQELSILGDAALMRAVPKWLRCTTFYGSSMGLVDPRKDRRDTGDP